ncbi:uncharacterized protein CLAFUR5_14652 [Fulvia fulva]|uniref:Uncharacterized protein n=1 Tax=Passalora fulva TaxID=5499 RepID=A0A9Q8PMM5_PASFU|nr:uncharacterized protein CLAFUR5_14652 [Fulvia fulva]KAK4608903.1 hypothetical protein CLAFUR0_14863 [Fulvia fulva]UJO25424.1 hypothetical protein CLAFUR5_14652 [Fulvia fulva]
MSKGILTDFGPKVHGVQNKSVSIYDFTSLTSLSSSTALPDGLVASSALRDRLALSSRIIYFRRVISYGYNVCPECIVFFERIDLLERSTGYYTP